MRVYRIKTGLFLLLTGGLGALLSYQVTLAFSISIISMIVGGITLTFLPKH
ncbi:MAG: hypothetical protein HN790_13645 [Methylococcales bacterium]|nr:hypothetical protein [Methylococcales bacterium]